MKMPKLFINRIFNKKGPPIHLIWFVTARCNFRCLHCFYHAQVNKADEFSLEEIERTISHLSPVLSIILTGGEPFLRGDLPEITKLLSDSKLTENILLFSNGFETDNILITSEKILHGCPDTNIFIGISIDGYEKEHDEYRGKKGAYKKAIDTITGLKALKKHFSNLKVGVGITLHSGNQHIVNDLRKDIYSSLGIIPGITMIRGNSYLPELKNVDSGIYKKIVEAIECDRRSHRKESLLEAIIATREVLGQKLAYETFIGKSRSYDCYAGSLMGVIYENGDVYPCEMLDGAKMGNLRDYDYDINKIWESARANEIREFVKARKCFCTYECQYTCNTLYNPKFSHYFLSGILDYLFKPFNVEKQEKGPS